MRFDWSVFQSLQYNLVLGKIGDALRPRRYTAGLAKSNGRPAPGLRQIYWLAGWPDTCPKFPIAHQVWDYGIPLHFFCNFN